MQTKNKKVIKKITSTMLAAILLAGILCIDAGAAAPRVIVDESVYVNLDYYGAVEEVNVVKGCAMNGNTNFVDYGTYKEVVNMTNSVKPIVDNGQVIWDLNGYEEERFYFECKTDELSQELPWTLDVSYKLNGKECRGEELAGAEGLVTMEVQALPNVKAPKYYRNNMILTVATVVDMDKDTYSLEAPGSQLQTLGTKKAVIFMALPGEEGNFRIDIGTKNFESIGLMFMMIPATLSSLDRISDIREVKDKVKDSLDAMSDSADVILDNLTEMKGGLEETKKGIQEAKKAKAVYDAGRDQVKSDADLAIASLDNIKESLILLSAQTAIEKEDYIEAMEQLETMRHSIYEMDEYLEDMEDASKDLQKDLRDIRQVLKNSSTSDLEDAQKTLRNLIGSDESMGNYIVGEEVTGLAKFLTKLSKASAPATRSSEALIHEIENLTQKASEVLNEGNALGGRMTNEYKEHVLQLMDEVQAFLDNVNMTITATQTSLRSMRQLMDATEKSLDAAIDSSLNGMIGILDSGIGIAGGSQIFRDAKNTMKTAVDDEIDEIEEETNILEIDTSESFPSFTSDRNKTPSSIQIIMRTAEISIDDNVDNSTDIEQPPEDIGIWGRIKAVLKKMFGWLFN